MPSTLISLLWLQSPPPFWTEIVKESEESTSRTLHDTPKSPSKMTRKQSVRGTTVEIRYNTRFEILVPTFFYTLFCYSLEVKPDEYRHGYIRLNIYVAVNNLLGIFRVRQCALCSTTFLTYFQNTPMK